ncbi:hypothetical protein TELCIR_14153 [Teladorsagia circumcincta]|uniref:Uncharacterized protein n=1 Tax=Teladorsagia circumcincta TaxID=45464 RepID=A0A2G9U1S2_TELCI|nr:hypothetical protein TELCIR_14153 [Teladorsagia circumcincta]
MAFSPARVIGRLLSTFAPDCSPPTRREIAIADAFKGILLGAVNGDVDYEEEKSLQVVRSRQSIFARDIVLIFEPEKEIDEGRKCDVDPGRLSLDKFVSAVFFFIFADFYHVKYRKFRETHDCALAQYLRSESTCTIRRTTPRRSPQKVTIRQWSPTGITPTDPYVTN